MATLRLEQVGNHPMYLYGPETDCLYRLMVNSSYEQFEGELLKEFVHPGDFVLDVGAHVGYHTLALARRVGDSGWVTAFEPDPMNFVVLKTNVEMNGYSNVSLFPLALTNERESKELHKGIHNTGDNRLWQSQRGRQVVSIQTVKLDELMNVESRVDFIKIDTQGCECHVLKGMGSLISHQKKLTVAMEFWPYGLKGAGSSVGELEGLLKGFELFHVNGKTNKLDGLKSLEGLIDPRTDHFTNLICTKTK